MMDLDVKTASKAFIEVLREQVAEVNVGVSPRKEPSHPKITRKLKTLLELLSDSAESESSSRSLFYRIFLTRTGIHFRASA